MPEKLPAAREYLALEQEHLRSRDWFFIDNKVGLLLQARTKCVLFVATFLSMICSANTDSLFGKITICAMVVREAYTKVLYQYVVSALYCAVNVCR